MARAIAELSKQHMSALFLYYRLSENRFGKSKVDKYREIAKRMKLSEYTVKTWITKYFEEYKKYLLEIVEKKDLKKLNFEGLTEKQTKYVIARMNGKNAEEAKAVAGYSENTKVDTIEKTKGVALTMAALREQLIEDTKFGAMAVLDDLRDIKKRAEQGVKVIGYVDEVNPDGRLTRKTMEEVKSFSAELGAVREIRKMLGYDYFEEMKVNPSVKVDEETGEKAVAVSDEDMR